MAPLAPAHEAFFDIHPVTGASIEVFFADQSLETFGWRSAGWFWWPRRCGFAPTAPAIGPFLTGYVAYRHALGRGEYVFGRRCASILLPAADRMEAEK